MNRHVYQWNPCGPLANLGRINWLCGQSEIDGRLLLAESARSGIGGRKRKRRTGFCRRRPGQGEPESVKARLLGSRMQGGASRSVQFEYRSSKDGPVRRENVQRKPRMG